MPVTHFLIFRLMIRSLLIATVLLAGADFIATAQADRAATPKAGANMPPAAVQTAFAQLFPKATAVKWEKEGTLYEADFGLQKVKMSAVYTASGEFKEIERPEATTALPAPVLPYLNQKYTGQEIKEVARIEDAAGTVTWETEVGGKDLIFDAAGSFLREEIEATGDDKDGDD